MSDDAEFCTVLGLALKTVPYLNPAISLGGTTRGREETNRRAQRVQPDMKAGHAAVAVVADSQ